MITLDVLNGKPSIVCSEEDDVLILNNFHYFGIQSVSSFVDDTSFEGETIYFERYFQYTVDGIHWSEWIVLKNDSLSSIITKSNHLFSIRYKYIRKGVSTQIKLHFHSITLNISYSQPQNPSFYRNFFTSKYFNFFNIQSIEWSVNILNKVFHKGVVPIFIERSENKNWEDEDFINFWWNIIYFQSLKVTYDEIYSNLLHYPDLLKEFIRQKGLFVSNDSSVDEYHYILSHYYDEVMKRGSASVLDKNRTLPESYNNVSIKGELLRLCGQNVNVESVFGVITEYESGWIVNHTSPCYKYSDFYRDFVRAYELGESVENLSLYPLLNSQYITEEEIVVDGKTINAIKINTAGTTDYAGIMGAFSNAILVDEDSDYEISFKVRGLVDGSALIFGVYAFDSLGTSLEVLEVDTLGYNDIFLSTNKLNGDFFIKGNLMFKNRASYVGNVEFEGQKILKLPEATDRIAPMIIFNTLSACYIYDIKIRVLPVTGVMSYLSTAGELIIKLANNASEFSDTQIRDMINEKLIPLSLNISQEQRIGVSEEDEYIPYELPFILRLQ